MPVEADDARAAHALGQVLVGRADHDLLDAGVVARQRAAAGGQRVVGLELDHRPDDDAERARPPARRAGTAPSARRARPRRSCSRRTGRLRNDSITWSNAHGHVGDARPRAAAQSSAAQEAARGADLAPRRGSWPAARRSRRGTARTCRRRDGRARPLRARGRRVRRGRPDGLEARGLRPRRRRGGRGSGHLEQERRALAAHQERAQVFLLELRVRRTMCGVRVITMSVCRASVLLRAKSRPRIGMLARPGRPVTLVRSLSLMRPARMLVSPSCSRMTLVTVRLLKVGRPWKPGAPTAETSSLRGSVTSPSWWTRGVMSMLTPTFLYSNDVIGCWEMPPVAMGANVVTGTGTWSPKRAWAVWPSRGAQLRVGQQPRGGVGLQQAVDDAGQPGDHEVVLGVGLSSRVSFLGGIGEDGARDALDPRGGRR